ncbi:MAG: hypothetical protein JO199_14985 [Candidatus Eremiobacteraeota bacterium]|nr:hypothetical protein [Candidatus Eremiobacteraeota bacterium]
MAIVVALIVVLVIAAGGAIYAIAAPRRKAAERVPTPDRPPLHADDGWTNAAGDEFSGLSEPARCDLIFAVAALGDDRSMRLLEHALDDPAEAVSIAAAHALHRRGCNDVVDRYLAAHPGERSERIASTLALLAPES